MDKPIAEISNELPLNFRETGLIFGWNAQR